MKFSLAELGLSMSLASNNADYIPGEKIVLNGSIKNGTRPVSNHTVIIAALYLRSLPLLDFIQKCRHHFLSVFMCKT